VTRGTRPRVALVVPNLASGGGVTAVARFIKDAAVRHAYELRVVSLSESAVDPLSLRVAAPSSWWRGAVARHGEWDGLPCVYVGAVGGELEFQRYQPRRALTQVLNDCDIIQVVGGFPAWANAVLGIGKPVALHVATRARLERRQRDADPHGVGGWWRKTMTGITDRLDDRALRGADAIQVMNPGLLDYTKALNTGREVDLRYLPPGVNTDVFTPARPPVPAAEGSVLCVGRLGDPRKSVGVLLEAFALLPETVRAHTRLVLAGAEAPPAAFWQRADALGLRERITFVEQPDRGALLRLYQSASVFALPSDEEGFGMVVLEAMACGVPVVSTRSGGPEGIITDHDDGYLVDRHDAPAMASRLALLLQQPERAVEMGQRARRTIEGRYDERVLGDVFVEIWERLARSAGAA